jgi:putative oxidoreductase
MNHMPPKIANLVSFNFLKVDRDIGLLLLRLGLGLSLFLKHGWEKPALFSEMATHFPDPLHIGAVPSLVFALVCDAVCSLLVAVGLATRWAALAVVINISVAWLFVHHAEFFGKQADHGEVCVLYIIGYLVLFVTGPGRHSVDARIVGA